MDRASVRSIIVLSAFSLTFFTLGAQADTQVSSASSTESSTSYLPIFNFRLAPMGLLTASPGMDVDVRLSPSFSLGPSMRYFEQTQGNTNNNIYQFGLQAAYYFGHEGILSSWYARAGVYALHSGASNPKTSAVLTSWIESVAGGYTFRFGESHFNATLGTGLSYFANAATEGVQPILEMYFGWAI
jgi:hypothetical protein